MLALKKSVMGMTVLIAIGACVSGCSTMSSVGQTVGVVSTPKPEPDMPERPPLVMPPQNAQLPTPGQPAQSATVDQSKKTATN